MEDVQLIIYILFGIIYLVFSVLKKRRKEMDERTPPLFEEEEERPVRRASTAVPEQHEPRSLEELLERYDQAARRAKGRAAEKVETMQEQTDEEFVPVASRQPEIRNMEAEAMAQLQRTERLKSLQEELPANARVEVLRRKGEYSSTQQPPLVAKRKREKPRFAPYDQRRKTPPLLEQIRSMARSRKAMQQAIIVTEILNRKHF